MTDKMQERLQRLKELDKKTDKDKQMGEDFARWSARTIKQRKKKAAKQSKLEAAAASVIDTTDGLPGDIIAMVEDAIQGFCARYGIESMVKAPQPQWRACCMYIGRTVFKEHKLLHDRPREVVEGGTRYSDAVVDGAVDLWAYLCGVYAKTPLVADFTEFAGGISGYLERTGNVSPAHIRVCQKLKAIQEGGLAAQIADGKTAPVGPLAILNHFHGWTSQREVIHTTRTNILSVDNLPRLDKPQEVGLPDLDDREDGEV